MSKGTKEIMAQAEKININDGEFLIVKIDMKKHGQLSWSKIENLREAFGDTRVLIADVDIGFEKADISDLEEMLKQLNEE